MELDIKPIDRMPLTAVLAVAQPYVRDEPGFSLVPRFFMDTNRHGLVAHVILQQLWIASVSPHIPRRNG